MSVKKEPSERRCVQVEVPGAPEEVWQAVAPRSMMPAVVKLNFGDGDRVPCAADCNKNHNDV
jgi:hypothetical protein